MIEPNDPTATPPEQPSIEVTGKLKGISTTETDWNTRVAYDVTIRTYDPQVLGLATLKAQTKLKLKVTPSNEPQAANTKKERK